MPFLDQRYQLLNGPRLNTLLPAAFVVTGAPGPGEVASPFTPTRENVIICQSGSNIILPLITPQNQGRAFYIKRRGDIDPLPVTVTPQPSDAFDVTNFILGAPLTFGPGAASYSAILLVAFTRPVTNIPVWWLMGEFQMPPP